MLGMPARPNGRLHTTGVGVAPSGDLLLRMLGTAQTVLGTTPSSGRLSIEAYLAAAGQEKALQGPC